MKKILLSILMVLSVLMSVYAENPNPTFTSAVSGINFTENKGQIQDQFGHPRPDVLFAAMAGDMSLHLKKTGLSYQLYRVEAYKEVLEKKTRKHIKVADQTTIYRIDLNWLNYNADFKITQDEAIPGYNNYYLPVCPDGALNVKSYKGVFFRNIYKGIDLHYYEKNGELKHDYIVAPNSDYKQIQVEVNGADISVNSDGSLLLSTPLGKVQEGAPLVFQKGKPLSAKWIVKENVLSFYVENYDPAFELIIDPVSRLWGTYYGGNGDEAGFATTQDRAGNVFLTGYTYSKTGTFVATTGSHQSSFGGGFGMDGFLVKFNANGSRVWGTYYGGYDIDVCTSVATSTNNFIYVAGYSSSTEANVIATPSGHQYVKGAYYDAFLVKFSTQGFRQFGTFYGGSSDDVAYGCAVDAFGDIYIAGETGTATSNIISTANGHQVNYGGNNYYDAFLAKFNSSGQRQWGTYYGGTYEDRGLACATDNVGNVYLSGMAGTNASGIISTPGSHQQAYAGNGDAYLVKFDQSGIRQWGTYYGGPGTDYGQTCATDPMGDVFLAGYTPSSSGGIGSSGSHQPTYGGGANDGYIVKFDANGVRQWGTYYGGIGDDNIWSCSVDIAGSVYFGGGTTSNAGSVMATPGSYQPTFGGGGNDAYFAKFDLNGVRQWGTYYGGAGDEGASCIFVDSLSTFYVCGTTIAGSGTRIATPTSHQPVFGGGPTDAFLVRFCNTPAMPLSVDGPSVVCAGDQNITFSISPADDATAYVWSFGSDWAGTSTNNSISVSPGTSGMFSVIAFNACGSSQAKTFSVNVSECTGIGKTQVNNVFHLYPNPSNGKITIELKQSDWVTIINYAGQIVYEGACDAGNHQIDMSHLASGIYLLTLKKSPAIQAKIVNE